MTYSLPFGLTQKPVNKYVVSGVIKFSCREGNLYYEVKQISKIVNATIQRGIVKTKKDLDTLLSIKSFDELHLIEVVQ